MGPALLYTSHLDSSRPAFFPSPSLFPSSLLSPPPLLPQAIHCCLHGITENEEEACEKFSELAADKTCVANVMDRSGSRVAVELIVSESECQETVNSILMKDFHPISTLAPNLPSVSLYTRATLFTWRWCVHFWFCFVLGVLLYIYMYAMNAQ